MTVLVTGATGNVGAQAVRELRARGVPVRAFVRDPERAAEQLGADVELAVGDLSDPASVARAVAGADRVLLSTGDGPEKVRQETTVDRRLRGGRRAAARQGLDGGRRPGVAAAPLAWHGEIEAHLRRAAVPAVVLRSSFHMTNLLMAAEPVRHDRALIAPAGDGAIAMLDPRDTGSAAAVVLTQDGHAGRTYELTGPEPVTYARVAAELSEALGTPVAYVDAPPEAARAALEAAGPAAVARTQLDGVFALVRAGALGRDDGRGARAHGPPAARHRGRSRASTRRRSGRRRRPSSGGARRSSPGPCRPRRTSSPGRRCSSRASSPLRSVVMIRAPVIPKGWPSAIAPPKGSAARRRSRARRGTGRPGRRTPR